MPSASARSTSSGVVPAFVARRYAKASSALPAQRTAPPEQIEMPPPCGIFSQIRTFAPVLAASIAAMPPAKP